MAFPSTPVLDSFTGSNEDPITTNWTTPIFSGDGNMRRNSNALSSSVDSLFSDAYYDLATFGPACEAYVTVTTAPTSGHSMNLFARLQDVGTSGVDGYSVYADSGGMGLWRITNGTETWIDSAANVVANGDKIGIRCVGQTIEGWHYTGGTWSLVMSIPDTTYNTAGRIGVQVSHQQIVLDDFGGGTIVAEGFPTTGILDDFNRANNTSSLGSNWTDQPDSGYNSLGVLSNQAYANAGFQGNYWSAEMFEADQECFVTVPVLPVYRLKLYLRLTDPGGSYNAYEINVLPTSFELNAVVGGVGTSLAGAGASLLAGDLVGFRAVGTTITAYVKHSGIWSQLFEVTDSSVSGPGYIGMHVGDETTVRIDDFGGGTYSPYAAEVLTDEPAAYYRMDEASGLIQDYSGYDNHADDVAAGITYGAAGLIASDPSNDALSFSTDYVSIPDHATLDITGELTLEAWLVATSYNDYSCFIGKYVSGSNAGYDIHVRSDGRINFTVRGGGSAFEFESAAGEILLNTLYHIVATYKDSTNEFFIYKNGVQVASTTNAVSLSANAGILVIGARADNGSVVDGFYWPGTIDEVAVYPTALSAARVYVHYALGIGNYAGEVLTDSPEVYYRLGETSGTTYANLGSAGSAANATANATVDPDTSLLATDPDNASGEFNPESGTVFKADTTYILSQFEPVTFEFWCKPRTLDAFDGTNAFIVTAGSLGVQFADATGEWSLVTYGVKDYAFTTAPPAVVGVTQHIVVTLDAAHDASIYVDGQFIETVTHTAAPGASSDPVIIANLTGDVAGANAYIDEVAIYPTVLSPARVLAHYAAGVGGYASEVLADSPAAYYRLNEATYPFLDVSGNANHSIDDSISLTYEEPGLISTDPNDTAMGFNGTDSWIQIADDTTLDITGEITLEAWIHPTALDNGLNSIFTKYDATNDGGYDWYVTDSGAIYLAIRGGGFAWEPVTSTGLISVGNTYHVVATYDDVNNGETLMYVNGVQVYSSTTGVSLAANTGDLDIGARGLPPDELHFTGRIDEVAIYPTVLSAQRVAAHYAAGIGGYAAEVIADTPVVYYRMKEASGQLQDYSGNGNHTTSVVGTPTYGQPGKVDDAILVASSYFTAPHHASLNVGDTFSLEAWAKRPSIDSNEHQMIGKGQDGTGAGPGIYIYTDGRFMLGHTGVIGMAFSSIVISDTNWHHFVATKNGSTMRLYVDGIDVSDPGSDSNSTVTASTAPLTVGLEYNFGPSAASWEGTIDEVAMYDTVLSPARVFDHYAAGVGGYVAEVLVDEPVAYYRMNEASGLIRDSSGHENDANDSVPAAQYQQASPITTDIGDKSIFFDGDTTMRIPHDSSLNVGDVFTLECWIKRTTTGIQEVIFDKWTGTPAIHINADNTFSLIITNTEALVHSSSTITDTNWHHIVATKNGTSMFLYLDGVDDTGTIDNTTACTNNTERIEIGATQLGTVFVDSYLDEVAIYNTALSAARVLAHYEAAIAEVVEIQTFYFYRRRMITR